MVGVTETEGAVGVMGVSGNIVVIGAKERAECISFNRH